MITTSEIKISVIVDEDRVDEGANLVHAGFGLAEPVLVEAGNR